MTAVRDGAGPKRTVATVAVLFTFVAVGSLQYPPDYLSFPLVHAALSAWCVVSCVVLMVRPGRWSAAFAGSVAVTVCWLRAGLILGELIFNSARMADGPRVSFAVAAVTWAAFGVVLNEAWAVSVVPWVAARRAHDHDP